MANWRYHSRLRINPYNPSGRGTCDRCSQIVNHADLIWQLEYRGNTLQRTGFLVCDRCLDVPYQGRRPIIIPADPVPFLNPRTEPLQQEEAGGVAYILPPTPSPAPAPAPSPSPAPAPAPAPGPTTWDTAGATWDTLGDTWDE